MHDKCLHYGLRLLRYQRIAGRTGEPGLTAQVIQSDGSERLSLSAIPFALKVERILSRLAWGSNYI